MNENIKCHLEIQQHRKNPYGLIRSSYREDGKLKHKTMCRITGVSIDTLKLIQAAMQGNVVMKSDFKILQSKEYGASFTFLQLARITGLDKIIYSRPSEPWVRDCLAMIIGRIVYAGSKLSLTRINKDSSLWELCGTTDEKIDVNHHCYDAMDQLFSRQAAIQKKLAAKHLTDNSIILYDITSSYLEGDYTDNDLVSFGYNRDKKRGHEQIVIGLICNKDGCPIAVEVFRGNTKDESTVQDKILQIKETYGVKDAIFVGDRGMVTKTQFEKIHESERHFIKTISALTHAKIKKLCELDGVQLSMFDEKNIKEIILPDNPNIRYGLCKNPIRGEKERITRLALLDKTKQELEKIASSSMKTEDGKLGIRVGKVINKYKMGKFVKAEIKDGKLLWELNAQKIAEEERFDGLYVIFTDVTSEDMNIKEVVENYRKLIHVEQAFRNLKSTQLEIRPIYHKTEHRIKCHVFLCMLSYYLMWQMKQLLKPLTENDVDGKNREYTFEYIVERLKSIRKETIEFSGAKSEVTTECDAEQEQILNLLGVKIK